MNFAQRFAVKKGGAFRGTFRPSVTIVTIKNETCGNHCPPLVFLAAVVASTFTDLRFLCNSHKSIYLRNPKSLLYSLHLNNTHELCLSHIQILCPLLSSV